MEDELLTTKQVAKLLTVSQATLESWRSGGGGPRYCRIGKLIRYRRSALQQWLDAQEDYEHVAAERAAAEQAGREFKHGRPPRAGQD